jgi:hypothetical protein
MKTVKSSVLVDLCQREEKRFRKTGSILEQLGIEAKFAKRLLDCELGELTFSIAQATENRWLIDAMRPVLDMSQIPAYIP